MMPPLSLAEISIDLIEAANPVGGPIVVIIEVYIDESGTHSDSSILTLAGYVFTHKNAKKFSRKLAKVLEKYCLPYFHMVDCAHGNAPFDKLTKQQCDGVERKLIALVREHSECGFAVSLDRSVYADRLTETDKKYLGGEYSFCVRECLTIVGRWAERENFQGQAAYYFEAGHQFQTEANRILNESFKQNPNAGEKFKYLSHTFVDKRSFLPLQSADLLAWQWHTQMKRDKSIPPRKDLEALLRPQDMHMNLSSKANLEELFDHLHQWVADRQAGQAV